MDFPQENRRACITYTRDPRKKRMVIEREREQYAGYRGPAWLYPASFVAYHLGSITADPWKNLPVRFGAINFHFA